MKIFSLLKAMFTEDMNMFNYSVNRGSKMKKILLPIILFLIVSLAIGYYAYTMGNFLYDNNLTYILLSLIIIIVTVISFNEGIYKSIGILFENRDNDLLFAMPIKKSYILLARIFKLMVFQYFYNLMFLLPVIVVYGYLEKPSISFYLLSFLMTFLVPIIPTVLSSVIGYVIKLISSRFKKEKLIQMLLSLLTFLVILLFGMYINDIMQIIVEKATSINDMLTKLYYPLGVYLSLIDNFDIWLFIKLILYNLIPLVLFIVISSRYYFKIIFNTRGQSTSKKSVKRNIYIRRSKMYALVVKELRRYFSSSVYIFNTIFSLLLILVITIVLCMQDNVTNMFFGIEDNNIDMWVIYYGLVLFSLMMSSITSSSISLEGRTINITKSLPISIKDIFISKIIYPYIIELPFILVSEIIFFIRFKIGMMGILLIVSISILSIALSSILGLIINLKYPKLTAKNDTEVIKQSMSSMIAVFVNIFIIFLSIVLFISLYKIVNIYLLIVLHVVLFLVLTIVLYRVLMNKTYEYMCINV